MVVVMKKQKKVEKNIFLGLNCRGRAQGTGRAPLNQRSFEQRSKNLDSVQKICAMLKNSMFELQWRPLKSFTYMQTELTFFA